ncbi:tyrosine-protein phosphatase [Sphingomonas sp. BIUV-7]|uniref:Tyrosine-protein phosphatase n=1 Tax=Sphingomonas natans TaxID=3063330 RepID=A0ABT8Y855_9SPHN|nr:tyrosine-protein phosphatase [Sphingomonas sp. BIUV-7]MDO6414498.1 tyrosine-protein phosphatase [Sphingomonas sp. BIUV-7]
MRDRLSRAVNLRDLGGFQAFPDGTVVRRGRLYRAATLSGLDGELLEVVRALGIRTIIDFRHNGERTAFPTPWEALGCTDYWCRDHHASGADLGPLLRSPDLTADDSRGAMLSLYRALPYEQSDAFIRLFRSVIDGRWPVLFHCAAGKDRTGVAAALILAALGVARTDIVKDYGLTAEFDLLASPPVKGRPPMSDARRASVSPMIVPDPAYLDAMFEAVTERSGSLDAYLAETLALTADDRETLRAVLLE